MFRLPRYMAIPNYRCRGFVVEACFALWCHKTGWREFVLLEIALSLPEELIEKTDILFGKREYLK